MSFYLNELEWGLLSQLGRKCGSTKTAPWECLCAIAAALGYRVDSAGDLQTNGQAGPGKKKRKAGDGLNEPTPSEPSSTLADAPSLLVPAESLQADGEAAYLADFRAETIVDDRPATAASPLAQAVASNDPNTVLRSLLAPCAPSHFAGAIRERAALLVRRPHSRGYNGGVLSGEDIWQLLKSQPLRYGTNVDVARYTAARRRETFNFNASQAPPEEEEAEVAEVADWRVVRKRFAAGSSVRLLHPQRWSDAVAALLAPLEQVLQCPLGCNAYLTPPSSQGFAPHFDDVDVYVLQVEGRKRWRVYAPLPGHALPRYSSRDFVDSEVGACMLEAVLEPGDLLYLPRGTIHQAASLPDELSLHLTVSADHRRAWADLLEATLQEGIDDLRKTCFASRLALPPALYHCAGLLHRNRLKPRSAKPHRPNGAALTADSHPEPQAHLFPAANCQLSPSQLHGMRGGMAATLDALMVRLAACLHGGASDRATDTLAAAFVAQRLPPSWLPEPPEDLEGEEPDAEEMAEVNAMRMAAPTLARLVDEADPDCVAVRHCLNNSRTLHAAASPTAAADAEAEEHVLRLPFFLVPRPAAAAVAAQLLNAAPAQQPGAPAATGGDGGGAPRAQQGKKKGKRKRGGAAAKGRGAVEDGRVAADAGGPDTHGGAPGGGQEAEDGLLCGGGSGGSGVGVFEEGSLWKAAVDAGGVGVGEEGGVREDSVMDREEVEEVAAQVKWTMARLGLCAR